MTSQAHVKTSNEVVPAADKLVSLKATLKDLGAQREAMEEEIADISERLNGPGMPGLKGSLLDKQVGVRSRLGVTRGVNPVPTAVALRPSRPAAGGPSSRSALSRRRSQHPAVRPCAHPSTQGYSNAYSSPYMHTRATRLPHLPPPAPLPRLRALTRTLPPPAFRRASPAPTSTWPPYVVTGTASSV